ncbi:ribosome-associated protein [Desulfarculales bacterium]
MTTRPRSRPQKPRDTKDIALLCMATALRKKATDLLLLNVRAISGYTDYLLLASGRSTRQAGAIAEGIEHALKKASIKPLGQDGIKEGRWALIDFGDVVVHGFHQPVREFYDLESLWSNAPRVEVDLIQLESLLPPDSLTVEA